MTRQDPFQILRAAVMAFTQMAAPGRWPTRIKIQLDHDPKNWISLPITPAPAPQPHASEENDQVLDEQPMEQPRGIDRCTLDIITTLEEVRHRLTTTRLLSEMNRKKRYWSERTVAGRLSMMVEDGTLTNNQAARPKGYGLPEWDEQAAEEGPDDA